MENKQIIIDGVDVSGCKYYIENNGIEAQGCYELTDLCECNDENEFCDNNPNCHYKNWQRKEQECEELKKINKANAKSYEKHWYKLEKYKQTLAEIKEIAEKFYYQELGNRDCMNCDDYCFDKILQKISEVEK